MRRGVERGILVSTIVLALLLVIATFAPISSVCETIPMRIDYSVSSISGGPPYNIQILVNGNQAANIDNSPGAGFYNIEGTKGNQVTFKVNGKDVLANGYSYITFEEYGQETVKLTSISPPTTITPTPSADPCATPTATASPQPTTRTPSDVDDWILGPGLWSTPTPTPLPTSAPTTVTTATPTALPTPTPTPEPTPTSSSDMSSWWWLILLLIIVAIMAGYWYFTKQK